MNRSFTFLLAVVAMAFASFSPAHAEELNAQRGIYIKASLPEELSKDQLKAQYLIADIAVDVVTSGDDALSARVAKFKTVKIPYQRLRCSVMLYVKHDDVLKILLNAGEKDMRSTLSVELTPFIADGNPAGPTQYISFHIDEPSADLVDHDKVAETTTEADIVSWSVAEDALEVQVLSLDWIDSGGFWSGGGYYTEPKDRIKTKKQYDGYDGLAKSYILVPDGIETYDCKIEDYRLELAPTMIID